MKKAIAIAAALLLVVLVAAVVRSEDDSPDRAEQAISPAAASNRTSSVADGGDVVAVRDARERLRNEDGPEALAAVQPILATFSLHFAGTSTPSTSTAVPRA